MEKIIAKETADKRLIFKTSKWLMQLGIKNNNKKTPIKIQGEDQERQNGREVGGHGVNLFPWIYQEYTFRHRSTCRTPAESIQEYLTEGKNIKNHTKLGTTKELGGKTGV